MELERKLASVMWYDIVKYIPKVQAVIASVAILGLFSGAAFGDSSVFEVADGSSQKPTTYQVSLDELYFPGSGIAKIAAQSSLESLSSLVVDTITTTTKTPYLVIYPVGAAHVERNRRYLTDKIVVEANSAGAAAVASTSGVYKVAPVGNYAPNHYEVTVTSPTKTIGVSSEIKSLPGVRSVRPQIARKLEPKAIPNDPRFGDQWHLRNTAGGVDIDVTSVWDTYKGDGIVIGVVDTGVETGQEDLQPALITTLNHDFIDGDDDPNPDLTDWKLAHGTSCAGLAGGRGFNNIGICGVAPRAGLAGIRLIGGFTTDAQEAGAISWKSGAIFVKTNSWGPEDDFDFYDGPGPLGTAAILSSVTSGRGGKGTALLWAAGNGGDDDNSNFDGFANSIYVTAVGAIDETGKKIYYSEPGANIAVCAPSGGDTGTRGIVTTDFSGTYGYNPQFDNYSFLNDTNSFAGTSAACPQVAGVVALMLQANASLSYRDVKNILIRTAFQNDPGNTEWVTNAAGLHFNHHYGAGLVDAAAAVAMAKTATKLGGLTTFTKAVGSGTFPLAIPSSPSVATITIPVSTTIKNLEHAVLVFSSSCPVRGDIKVTLTSPQGTTSVLSTPFEDLDDLSFPTAVHDITAWPYSTVHSWGEDPNGNWTVSVTDTGYLASITGTTPSTGGSVTAATLKLYGTNTVGPSPTPPPTANGITVTSHADGASISSGSVNIRGTAASSAGVRQVEYRISVFGAVSSNSKPNRTWLKASGTNPWSISAKLGRGYYTVELRIVDTTGTASSISSLHLMVK